MTKYDPSDTRQLAGLRPREYERALAARAEKAFMAAFEEQQELRRQALELQALVPAYSTSETAQLLDEDEKELIAEAEELVAKVQHLAESKARPRQLCLSRPAQKAKKPKGQTTGGLKPSGRGQSNPRVKKAS